MVKQRGFTLVEVLIVIVIISIVSGIALLTISRNENRRIKAFTHEFVQLVTLAQEQAILQPAVYGVFFTQDKWQFVTYQPASGKQKQTWLPSSDRLLGVHNLPRGIAVMTESTVQSNEEDDEDKPPTPQIIISSNGDFMPFKMYVGKIGQAPLYVIQGAANGDITSAATDS